MIKSIYRRAAELGIPAGVYLTVAMLSIVFGDKLPPPVSCGSFAIACFAYRPLSHAKATLC